MAQPKPGKLSVDQVLRLVDKLSPDEQAELRQKLGIRAASNQQEVTHSMISPEAESWLDANLGENLDPYEWLAPPVGSPIRYQKNAGFMISEDSA